MDLCAGQLRLSSFELQQAHYKQVVQDHPNWELKRIYADEGISGTSLKNRDAWNLNRSYRVPGCIVPKQRIVVFDLNRAEVIDRDDS